MPSQDTTVAGPRSRDNGKPYERVARDGKGKSSRVGGRGRGQPNFFFPHQSDASARLVNVGCRLRFYMQDSRKESKKKFLDEFVVALTSRGLAVAAEPIMERKMDDADNNIHVFVTRRAKAALSNLPAGTQQLSVDECVLLVMETEMQSLACKMLGIPPTETGFPMTTTDLQQLNNDHPRLHETLRNIHRKWDRSRLPLPAMAYTKQPPLALALLRAEAEAGNKGGKSRTETNMARFREMADDIINAQISSPEVSAPNSPRQAGETDVAHAHEHSTTEPPNQLPYPFLTPIPSPFLAAYSSPALTAFEQADVHPLPAAIPPPPLAATEPDSTRRVSVVLPEDLPVTSPGRVCTPWYNVNSYEIELERWYRATDKEAMKKAVQDGSMYFTTDEGGNIEQAIPCILPDPFIELPALDALATSVSPSSSSNDKDYTLPSTIPWPGLGPTGWAIEEPTSPLEWKSEFRPYVMARSPFRSPLARTLRHIYVPGEVGPKRSRPEAVDGVYRGKKARI